MNDMKVLNYYVMLHHLLQIISKTPNINNDFNGLNQIIIEDYRRPLNSFNKKIKYVKTITIST